MVQRTVSDPCKDEAHRTSSNWRGVARHRIGLKGPQKHAVSSVSVYVDCSTFGQPSDNAPGHGCAWGLHVLFERRLEDKPSLPLTASHYKVHSLDTLHVTDRTLLKIPQHGHLLPAF